jgi:GTP-binding protein
MEPLEPIAVEVPTVKMSIGVNKSPLAGKEGKLLTTRVIRDRLFRELDRNVALKVAETDSADVFEVSGRGQLHLTVLIETMRREGFELEIGPPTVIERKIDGKVCEPFEEVEVRVKEDYVGSVVDMFNLRKGELKDMGKEEMGGEGLSVIKYLIPTRGMLGVRSALMSATRGTALVDSTFHGYYPKISGAINGKEKGSLLAFSDGEANSHGIGSAQERGNMFIKPKDLVYKDMIVGVHQRPGDLAVNICKMKQLTNMRASGKDDSVGLVTPLELTLDGAVEYLSADEILEVTPTLLRMAKNPKMAKQKGRGGR